MWKRSSTVRLEYKDRNFCSTPNSAPDMLKKNSFWGSLEDFKSPPWLVLFSLLSRLDFSIFDWILAWIYIFLTNCLEIQGFLTPGFFIPLREVCVEADVSSSLLGSCELLQAPSSTSCSRIALFLHSEVPVCKYWTNRRKYETPRPPDIAWGTPSASYNWPCSGCTRWQRGRGWSPRGRSWWTRPPAR